MCKKILVICIFIILIIIFYLLAKQYNNMIKIKNSEKFRSSLDIYYQNTVDNSVNSAVNSAVNTSTNSLQNKNIKLNAIWKYIDTTNIYNNYYLITNQKNDILYITLIPINMLNHPIGEESDIQCSSYTIFATGQLNLDRNSVTNITIKQSCTSILKQQKILSAQTKMSLSIDNNNIVNNKITITTGTNTFIFKFHKLQTSNPDNNNILDLSSFQYNIPTVSTDNIDGTNINCPTTPVPTYACILEESGTNAGIISNTPVACATALNTNGKCKKENVVCSVNSALTTLNINNTNKAIPICKTNTNISMPYNNYINTSNIVNNVNNKTFVDKMSKYNSVIIINNINKQFFTLGYEFFGVNPGENYLTNELSWLNDYMNNNNSNIDNIVNNIELWNINKTDVDNNIFTLKTVVKNAGIKESRPILYPEFNNNGNTFLSLYGGGLEQQIYLENEKNISSSLNNYVIYSGNLRVNNGLFIESNNLLTYNLGKNYKKITLLSKPLENSKWFILGFNLNVVYNNNLVKQNYNQQITNVLLPILKNIKNYNYIN
jgi:hypothetical protein